MLPPAPLLHHPLCRRLPDEERPLEVGIEHPIPHRLINLQEGHAPVRPRVADDDGDGAERARFVHHPRHLRRVRDIRLDDLRPPPHAANLLRDLLRLILARPVMDDHIRPFPREAEGDCLPDTAR